MPREEFARRAKGKIGERRALGGPTLAEDRAIGAILFREEAACGRGKSFRSTVDAPADRSRRLQTEGTAGWSGALFLS
ncbi:hypothetical protein CH337_21440 [Rhodoblastus acidophilus]|nr:hypothetical protein CKO16_20135 [Rhodoblastus acidophilus]RAI16415.1 hypothetical protein CH337_21440 [Rhodoblastus acidophilus]